VIGIFGDADYRAAPAWHPLRGGFSRWTSQCNVLLSGLSRRVWPAAPASLGWPRHCSMIARWQWH